MLKHGDVRLYLAVRPFFLGLILGQITCAGFWMLIDLIAGGKHRQPGTGLPSRLLSRSGEHEFVTDPDVLAIVPMSHHGRFKIRAGPDERRQSVGQGCHGTRRFRTVAVWRHASYRHDQHSKLVRVGLNIAYHARWFNHYGNGHIEPLWSQTYERMPAEMQKL